jgi:hypothetical protein
VEVNGKGWGGGGGGDLEVRGSVEFNSCLSLSSCAFLFLRSPDWPPLKREED